MAPTQRRQQDIDAKVNEYESWINETLKRDLAKLYETKSRLQQEDKEWRQLQLTLERAMQPPRELKSLVELGAGVYCAAKVPDTSMVYMEVGLGFHVECTLQEAQRVANTRQLAAAAQLDKIDRQVAEQKATIKFALQAISELSGFTQ